MKTPHDLWLVVAAVVAMGVGIVRRDRRRGVDSLRRPGRGPGRDRRAGAARLEKILEARGVYVGLAVLLRVACETTAIALIAVVLTDSGLGVGWGLLVTVAAMAVISYVAVGVGPRTLGRQHAYSLSLASAFHCRFSGAVHADHSAADPGR